MIVNQLAIYAQMKDAIFKAILICVVWWKKPRKCASNHPFLQLFFIGCKNVLLLVPLKDVALTCDRILFLKTFVKRDPIWDFSFFK